MNYLHSIIHWFNNLETKRKLGLAAFITLIFSSTTFLGWWIFSPSYVTLFNRLDEQDANKILQQLEQENIPYQVQQGGQEILIDKNLVAKTRLKIMGSGLQLTGNVGFELFDKNDFGMSDFSQKINYQRALQGELERTISNFDEVHQTRVHLVIPDNRLFDQEENQPKAAVTLHLNQSLTPKQVQSIQQLVAASVAHLSIKNVILVDQNGNRLTQAEEDNLSSHFATKKTIEHYLNNKVMQILQKIFAKNQVIVKIDVAINYDELQRELVKPQTQGLITHEKEIKHSTLDKKGVHQNNQDLTLEKSYELGSEKELFKRASGTIERLTISVVLPQNTNAKTVAQIQRLIQSTVGFNEQRGDTMSVEALIAQPKKSTLKVAPALNSVTHNSPLPPFTVTNIHWDEVKKQEAILISGVFCVLGCSGIAILKRLRRKKRQRLLIELTQWLNHHE